MKSLYKKFLTFSLLAFFTLGCGDLEELNINPNEPDKVPAEYLVTRALYEIPDRYYGRDWNFEYGMLMVQHLAQDEYTDDSRYDLDRADFDVDWSDFYAVGLYDLASAKGIIEEDPPLSENVKNNQLAVIEIMTCFAFQTMTDVWGDIPYFEALTGENPQPAYDAQSAIYPDMIAKVSAAVSSITIGDAGFSSVGDIIFNGNMDHWQKFGNALLLRMGMRIADIDATLAATTVSAALGGNIFENVSESMKIPYRSDEELANPFWYDASAAGGSRDDFRVAGTLINELKDLDDPRLAKYADTTATGGYIGMPYGLKDPEAFALKGTTSDVGDMVEGKPDNPGYMLRYSEVKLLHAEAIERGFVSGNAETEFNAGVTAAMNEWEITDTDAIAAYLAANPYDAANWKASIGLQMWLALYTNGQEAWATRRRLDQPVLALPAAAETKSIPVRGLYPTDESATNQNNLAKVPYENNLTTRLWWDVN